MQIPELCSLFGTQYALLGRFQTSPREPCKKLALTFFGNGIFWGLVLWLFLSPKGKKTPPPCSAWRQLKLGAPLSRRRNQSVWNKILLGVFVINQTEGICLYVRGGPLHPLSFSTSSAPVTPDISEPLHHHPRTIHMAASFQGFCTDGLSPPWKTTWFADKRGASLSHTHAAKANICRPICRGDLEEEYSG